MNIQMKVGEIEAILDLLIAIEKKGQWQSSLEKRKNPHAEYFPGAIRKSIEMFSDSLPVGAELFDVKK